MIPRAEIALDASLPDDYSFWTPGRAELGDEEAFGGFRDTWVIKGITVREARDTVGAEAELVSIADRVARTDDEFEAVAGVIENWDLRSLPSELATPENIELLQPLMGGDPWPLEGLDLGVAGLVAALCAVKCFTAASCRGHPEAGSWSARPIVYVAADRRRAGVLQELVSRSGCGFARGVSKLLPLEARSIEDFDTLARMILDEDARFRPPRRS